MNEREKEEKKQLIEAKRRKRKRRKIAQNLLIVLLLGIIVVMAVTIFRLEDQKRHILKESQNCMKSTSSSTSVVEPVFTPTETPTPEPTPTESPVAMISSENLHSDYGYLIRLSDQAVMMDKEGEAKSYPSSLTKIMTLLVAIEKLPDLDENVTLSDRMIKELYRQGSLMSGFVGGENVTVKDLLYAVMMPSAADACIGLAEKVSGSEAAYVELMNQKAAELGMKNTHFTNCTGLHDENHYSTCKDLAQMMVYALKNDAFRSLFTAPNYTTTSTTPHPAGIKFENPLFKSLEGKKLNNGGVIEGGKTGYTKEAGLCLASLAKIGEEEYLLVTTHADGASTTEQFHVTDAFTVYDQIK